MNIPAAPPGVSDLLGRGRGTVAELFLARCERSPDRTFLTWEDESWTYAEARLEAERFAGWALATLPDDRGAPRVASFLPNRPEAMWAWLGTLLAGAVYVPLNRAHRGTLLADQIARSGAGLLVIDAAGKDLLPDLGPTSVGAVLRAEDWGVVAESEPTARPGHDPAAVAEVMFTSGTTGRSKAVLLPANCLTRGAGWVAWSLGLGEEDTVHGWLPLFHIGGQLDMVLAFIVGGGTVALHPTFSRSRFWAQVEASRATCFIGFSNVLEILWAMGPEEAAATLRAGIVGGIPPALHRDLEARFGVRLHDIYGMTEAEPLALPHPGRPTPVGAAGPPSPDFEIAILSEEGERMGPEEVGRIAFRPRVPDVMLAGYEGDAEATVAASPGLWFHTGDLGRIDAEGNVHFIDRVKHAIRRRGENISSFELERQLLEHPALAECAAVGVPSPLGEEDVKIVVVAKEGEQIDPSALRDWCAERMAAFMVPRYIEVSERLPRGPTGKVQKQDLAGVPTTAFDAEAGRSRTAVDNRAEV